MSLLRAPSAFAPRRRHPQLAHAERLEPRQLFSVFGFIPEEIRAASNTIRVATGDVNGDGRLDLVVTDQELDPAALSRRPRSHEDVYVWKVRTHLGNGDGTFSLASTATLPLESATRVAVGDVNGDGKADLVVSERKSGSIILHDPPEEDLFVSLGDGKGGFAGGGGGSGGGILLGKSFVIPHVFETKSIAVGDLDGDGAPEIAALGIVSPRDAQSGLPTGKRMGVFLLGGDRPNPEQPVPPGRRDKLLLISDAGDVWDDGRIFAGDLNRDGLPDLLAVDDANVNLLNPIRPHPNVVTILGNKDFGLLVPAVQPNPLYETSGLSGENPLVEGRTLGVGDFDGDGKAELIGALWNGKDKPDVVRANLIPEAGSFQGPANRITQANDGPTGQDLRRADFVAAGDVNGDGRADLLVFSGGQTFVGISTRPQGSKEDVYVWKVRK